MTQKVKKKVQVIGGSDVATLYELKNPAITVL